MVITSCRGDVHMRLVLGTRISDHGPLCDDASYDSLDNGDEV